VPLIHLGGHAVFCPCEWFARNASELPRDEQQRYKIWVALYMRKTSSFSFKQLFMYLSKIFRIAFPNLRKKGLISAIFLSFRKA
jgi:hypothetical protein